MPSRNTSPTTPEERAAACVGNGYDLFSEPFVLRLLDDIEERDALLERIARHSFDGDMTMLVLDIRALLAASRGAAEEPEPCPRCGSARKWSDYWTDEPIAICVPCEARRSTGSSAEGDSDAGT